MADGHAIFSKVAVEALGVACLQHHAVPSDSHLLICKMDLLFLCLVVTWFRLVVLRRLSQACATHCLFRFLLSIFALVSFFLSFFLFHRLRMILCWWYFVAGVCLAVPTCSNYITSKEHWEHMLCLCMLLSHVFLSHVSCQDD